MCVCAPPVVLCLLVEARVHNVMGLSEIYQFEEGSCQSGALCVVMVRSSAFIFVLSQVRIFRRASRVQKSPRKFHRTTIIFGVFRIFRNCNFYFLKKLHIFSFLQKMQKSQGS